jgi:LPXTG-site transpeptidase (sortase) family protein
VTSSPLRHRTGTAPARRRHRALPALGLALGLALTTAGCSTEKSPTASPPADRVNSAATPPATDTPAAPPPGSGTPDTSGTSGISETSAAAAAPVRVTIPGIGVDTALMSLGLNGDRTVQVPPPEQGMTAGWYTGASVPGEPGPAVIIGHNATKYGPAVFKDLKKLAKGDEINVRNKAGKTLRFRVTAKETVKKTGFPSQKVYGLTKNRDLRLITCDGGFDAEGHPVDNLIVYATLA